MVRSIIALNDRVSTLHRERRQRRERRALLEAEERKRNNSPGQENEQSTDIRGPQATKESWGLFAWLVSMYRSLFNARWVTLVPQRRERRLRTHSSFQDIWDNSLSWIVTKDSEGKYKGDDDEFSGSESDDDDVDDQQEETGDRTPQVPEKSQEISTIAEEEEEEEEDQEDIASIITNAVAFGNRENSPGADRTSEDD
eukprot:gene35274-42739_t